MGKGKRYEAKPKLNLKKVFAVIIAIIVIIMFIFILKNLLTSNNKLNKIASKTYFAVYKDNKWGVIDANGEFVINPSYEEMIIIPNNKVDVFLCVYDVNYETGEYKTKALNSKNQEIFKDYEKIESIPNINDSKNLWYESSVLRVQKDGKYGLINLSGKKLSECIYEEIFAVSGIENSYKIKKDNKYGIIDNEGKIILECQYTDISIIGEDNKSGYIVKDDAGKYGFIDYSNNIVLETKYDSIEKEHNSDLYIVTEAGTKKLIKKDGTEVLSSGFDEIAEILKAEENGIIFIKAGKYGVMNLAGEIKIEATYDSIKEAKSGVFIAKTGDKYGIIDINGEQKLEFNYSVITYDEKSDIYIAEDSNYIANILNGNYELKISGILLDFDTDKGYIKTRENDENKYYNLKFESKQESEIFATRTLFLSKKDGKYGYVNKSGKVIVDYIYDDATEQNDYGYAAIKKDGKWGSIDSNGNVIQEPIYNLDDYLLVDFIGKWHLGKDVNMKFYNQE